MKMQSNVNCQLQVGVSRYIVHYYFNFSLCWTSFIIKRQEDTAYLHLRSGHIPLPGVGRSACSSPSQACCSAAFLFPTKFQSTSSSLLSGFDFWIFFMLSVAFECSRCFSSSDVTDDSSLGHSNFCPYQISRVFLSLLNSLSAACHKVVPPPQPTDISQEGRRGKNLVLPGCQ